MSDDIKGVDPILPYETYSSHPTESLGGHIVFARLKTNNGKKVLARVLIRSTIYDKKSAGYDNYFDKYPFYSGAILQYIPLNGPVSFEEPDLESISREVRDSDFIPSMKGRLDFHKTYLLPENVLLDLGKASDENPIPKTMVLKFVDPQGVPWKVRSFPKPAKGQTKQVIAWTKQYSSDDDDVTLEADTYDAIKAAILAFQSKRKRNRPSASDLAPVPSYNSSLKIYIENIPEEISDGVTTYKAFRAKDGDTLNRDKGRFYALTETPSGVTVVGPSPKFSDLEKDVAAMASKSMRAGLFGSSEEKPSLSSDDELPKSLQGLDLEEYLPWIGAGLGILALGAVAYAAKKKKAARKKAKFRAIQQFSAPRAVSYLPRKA